MATVTTVSDPVPCHAGHPASAPRPRMRRLLAALAIAGGLLVPTAFVAAAPACGPDPAFGYRTSAGYEAALDILFARGIAVRRTTDIFVDPDRARAELTPSELVIVAGAGILGDPLSNPFDLPAEAWVAFSGVVGRNGSTDPSGDGYYVYRLGQRLAGPIGSGADTGVDTAELYVRYLGAGFPTTAGVPCAPEPAPAPADPAATAGVRVTSTAVLTFREFAARERAGVVARARAAGLSPSTRAVNATLARNYARYLATAR